MLDNRPDGRCASAEDDAARVDAHETMEDKMIRMIRNEVLEKHQNY